eukprot:scpid28325/ scgid21154/ 
MNASGAELLSFAAFNQLCICNTWFPKWNIFKHTWHCIDFILVRQDDRHLCTDVAVIRSAECGSDHQLLYMALQLPSPVRRGAQSKDSVRRRFEVAQLKDRRTSSPEDPTPTDIYQAVIKEEIDRNWLENANISEKWSSIKSTLDTAASTALGFSKRRQPDWFQEALSNIPHLLDTQNAGYEDWLRRWPAARHSVSSGV